jgi:hypothetical protein
MFSIIVDTSYVQKKKQKTRVKGVAWICTTMSTLVKEAIGKQQSSFMFLFYFSVNELSFPKLQGYKKYTFGNFVIYKAFLKNLNNKGITQRITCSTLLITTTICFQMSKIICQYYNNIHLTTSVCKV